MKKKIIEVDNELWLRFKSEAVKEGLLIRELLEKAIEEYLDIQPEAKPKTEPKPKTTTNRPTKHNAPEPDNSEPDDIDEDSDTQQLSAKAKSRRFRG